MFSIIFAEKSETESSLIIIKYNHFRACISIEETFEMSDSELKIDSITKLFRLSDTFMCLIFRELSTIEKKTCRELIICYLLKKVRFLRHMRTTVCHTQ